MTLKTELGFEGCKSLGDYLGRFLYLISSNGISAFMDQSSITRGEKSK